MIENKLLVKIAEAVLTHIVGWGMWDTHSHEEWQAPKDIIDGLKVGNKVYGYNFDEEEIDEEIVCVVYRGVGFVMCINNGPKLHPVTTGDYYRTRLEAAEANRDTIARAIEYYSEKLSQAKKTNKLLGRKDTSK